MTKFLVALAIAYLGWRLWRGMPGYRPKVTNRPPEDAATAARNVLGVGPGAGPGEIRAAHRRLITAVHPDRGGSDEETRRLNAARDMLLKDSD